ncbi:MAG: epoxyqueuosine reductase QueH [Anaerolineae bacterium]
MARARVVDARGHPLSPCSLQKARRLVAAHRATLVCEDPFTIQLPYEVDIPEPEPEPPPPLLGQRLLLHICCAPCATWTLRHLAELGASVTGYWFNPNIHPFSEHEHRRQTLAKFADEQGLPMVWEEGYEMVAFLKAVADSPRQGRRCRLCYRMRLRRTAQRAAELEYDAFSTTLLISPYQYLELIRREGDEAAEASGVPFYFENMRRGFAYHHRLAQEHDLYEQRYCGCVYSEWESLDKDASTRSGR